MRIAFRLTSKNRWNKGAWFYFDWRSVEKKGTWNSPFEGGFFGELCRTTRIARVSSNSWRSRAEHFLGYPWRRHESHGWNRHRWVGSRRCWNNLSRKAPIPLYLDNNRPRRTMTLSDTWRIINKKTHFFLHSKLIEVNY